MMEKMRDKHINPSGFDLRILKSPSPGLHTPGGVIGRPLPAHASSSTGRKLKLGDGSHGDVVIG